MTIFEKEKRKDEILLEMKGANPLRFIRLQNEYCNLVYQIEAERRLLNKEWRNKNYKPDIQITL